jgi:large subunit ribosomal protein L1
MGIVVQLTSEVFGPANTTEDMMAKPGKNYRAALEKVDLNKQYSPQEGVALAKETAYTKFDASVEVHMRTALDPRQADQQLRDVVVLPHGLGKTVRAGLLEPEGAAASCGRRPRCKTTMDVQEDRRRHDGFRCCHCDAGHDGRSGPPGRVLGPRA